MDKINILETLELLEKDFREQGMIHASRMGLVRELMDAFYGTAEYTDLTAPVAVASTVKAATKSTKGIAPIANA